MWRGKCAEVDMEKLLAELYFEKSSYRDGFETVKNAVAYYPESPQVNTLLEEATPSSPNLIPRRMPTKLGDVERTQYLLRFPAADPGGGARDEMIRNLARRLVRVDLLAQAGDLLEYQISSRLKGVAQSQWLEILR
jgi:hypothetical protein